jgi:ribosome-dependent ATPase
MAGERCKAPPVARASTITHVYKTVHALENVSVDIPAGAMVGLLGPDAVGKSTLLGLFAGARKLQTGHLEVLGGNMADARHRRAVGPRIAYMPQGLGKNLYQELSIVENLDFFGKLFGQSRLERMARIERLTTATGLHPFLERPAGKLSGGMKQKLGLCCALIHDPDFLILDEPTTGVDPLSRRQFWELIAATRAQSPGMSVLVSTAYMDEAEAFDWLIAMDAGKVLATGPPQTLMNDTNTATLEAAFVSLLPPERREGRRALEIPPLVSSDRQPAIVARSLTRAFGDFIAVDHVSFEIQEGEIFGFLGSNGCGKTTTMKMLTGLLPASSGEAFLFGKPVDTTDLATRKRVGYMSQSFSLYGELTVEQNLKLHARLFDLPADGIDARVGELVARFGLGVHLHHRASALPLGLRQRLSLAVAIVHRPEMLILDEPTSGVDPIARDDFWQLLVDLSRVDKVTIFISTHFMNEAMRCDRISLMHAGKVLVCDEPHKLIEAKSAENLEEAFIRYMEDANGEAPSETGNTTLALAAPAITGTDGRDTASRTARAFDITRLLAYSTREAVEVMRDPVRLAFAFLGSMILLIIISYGISQDVENLTYATLDLDQTPQSRSYLTAFSGSRYFTEMPPGTNAGDLEARLRSNTITLAIEIPPNFGRDMKREGKPHVAAWIDGANTVRAGTIESYIVDAHQRYLETYAREQGVDASALLTATAEPRFRYNPSFESIYAMGPSIPAVLLLLFPAILMAVGISREKEIGTITNFYVTPTSRFEFLLGKQLPYIAIGMANFVILTLLVVLVLGVPLKGSFLALALGALCYVAAATGYGLLISTLTSTQAAAVLVGAVLSMLPTVQFSGIVQPVSTLEGGARLMGTLWPTTYYMHLSVGAFTKGLTFSDLMPDILALLIFIPVFLAGAALLLRKQEK